MSADKRERGDWLKWLVWAWVLGCANKESEKRVRACLPWLQPVELGLRRHDLRCTQATKSGRQNSTHGKWERQEQGKAAERNCAQATYLYDAVANRADDLRKQARQALQHGKSMPGTADTTLETLGSNSCLCFTPCSLLEVAAAPASGAIDCCRKWRGSLAHDIAK